MEMDLNVEALGQLNVQAGVNVHVGVSVLNDLWPKFNTSFILP